MLIDYIRQMHAKQNMKLGPDFEFVKFVDLTPETIIDSDPIPDLVELFAVMKVPFKGEVPDSYKVLNLMIGDWVAENEAALAKVIHQNMGEHFSNVYPNADASSLENSEDSAVWLDQLDYMPRIDEDGGFMLIEVELVLETEAEEEGE